MVTRPSNPAIAEQPDEGRSAKLRGDDAKTRRGRSIDRDVARKALDRFVEKHRELIKDLAK